MYLTIDIGNTSTKTVIFSKDTIKKVSISENLSLKDIKTIFSTYEIRASILSSVAPVKKDVIRFLQSHAAFVQLNSTVKTPVLVLYKTPGTLGSDRLAAVTGASKLFPGKNVLVIDAGTCIKYDFISSKKEYAGGSISPGLKMRFQALHNFTARLPLIEPGKMNDFIGTSTKNSILTGVQQGIINEINGFIGLYKKRFGSLKVILSGGDSLLFAGHIKSSIFAAPNLIHIGLHEILKSNVEQS
jgi:type III pantothenate kinase